MNRHTSKKLLLTALLIPVSAGAQVVLINPFTVPESKSEQTIIFWETARDYLQQQPGYISTNLHQTITPNSDFEFVNVAIWESDSAFKNATSNMKAHFAKEGIVAPEGVVNNPALYRVIRN